MALNKVELGGHISNVGPCWFFLAAASVVFIYPHTTTSIPDHDPTNCHLSGIGITYPNSIHSFHSEFHVRDADLHNRNF